MLDESIIQLLKASIKKEGWIELPASGLSMFPVLKNGDVCRFVRCEPASLSKGHIVLFELRGQLIAHRFIQRLSTDDEDIFLFKGDTNLAVDEPVSEGRIIGRLAVIRRSGNELGTSGAAFNLWGKLITGYPLLTIILRRFLYQKNRFSQKV
ncbi:hypothetical protein [Peribacillus sp. SCS-37]|uniref:hypothetical protein n=1 Tax=Paraperibacillus esterisolvens TaxID=3115296 RepID=UPI003906BB98